MQEENPTISAVAGLAVTLTPDTCNNEIDVSWHNFGSPSSISLDRIVSGVTTHERARVAPITFWADKSATNNFTTYTYNVYNYNYHGNMTADGSNSIYISSCSTQFSTAFIQDNNRKSSNNGDEILESSAPQTANIQGGTFELLVPYEFVINHYKHQTSVINSQEDWQLFRTLKLPGDAQTQATTVSLVQSISGSLEAIARVNPSQGSPYLVGYEFDASNNWQGPFPLMANDGPIDNVTGFAAMIQTNYDQKNTFELLVPRGPKIDHYIHSPGSILDGPWQHIHTLKVPSNDPQAQITAVAFIQSIPGTPIAIARVTPPSSLPLNKSDYLVGYELNTSADWTGPFPLLADDGPIDNVTGSSSFIESNFYDQDQFQLLVPRGAVIDYYTHARGSIADGRWQHLSTLQAPGDASQRFGGVWLSSSYSVRLESIARVKPSVGSAYLVGYEFNPASSEWSGPVPLRTKDGPILANDPQPATQGTPGCEPRTILTLLALALLIRVILRIFNRKR